MSRAVIKTEAKRYCEFFVPQDFLHLPISQFHFRETDAPTLGEYLGDNGELNIVFNDDSILKIDVDSHRFATLKRFNHFDHFKCTMHMVKTIAEDNDELAKFLKDQCNMVNNAFFIKRGAIDKHDDALGVHHMTDEQLKEIGAETAT